MGGPHLGRRILVVGGPAGGETVSYEGGEYRKFLAPHSSGKNVMSTHTYHLHLFLGQDDHRIWAYVHESIDARDVAAVKAAMEKDERQ